MRINKQVTVTAGVPVQLFDQPIRLNRYMVQMIHGATVGLGYVMAGIANRTPAATNAFDLTAELYPATATAPGGAFTDEDEAHGIRGDQVWLDGAVTGTKILITADIAV